VFENSALGKLGLSRGLTFEIAYDQNPASIFAAYSYTLLIGYTFGFIANNKKQCMKYLMISLLLPVFYL